MEESSLSPRTLTSRSREQPALQSRVSMESLKPCDPTSHGDGPRDGICACRPQPGTELFGDLAAEYNDCNAREPLLPEDTVAAGNCLTWQKRTPGDPSRANGPRRVDDSARPEISYVRYSNVEYRPCDVLPGGVRVCDLLAGGLNVQDAEACASLCTCMRDLPNVYCNAVAWVWGDGLSTQAGNCFPKFIEGVEQLAAQQNDLHARAHILLWHAACMHGWMHVSRVVANLHVTAHRTHWGCDPGLPNDGKLPLGSCKKREKNASFSIMILRNETQGGHVLHAAVPLS